MKETIEFINFLLERRLKLLKIFILPITILILNSISSNVFNMYNLYEWFDIPMHFFGGVTIGIAYTLFIKLIERNNFLKTENKLLFFFIVISMIGLTTVIWEFLEFSLDQLFGTIMQPSLKDTMADLFLGITGGSLSSLITMIFSKQEH
ncbi:MAG: hypothetical protein AABW52_03175 [Nanoarchaeota archaeon]